MNRYQVIPHRIAQTSTFLFVLLITLGGCRAELFDQEYGEPLEKSEFFADKRMSRPLVEGTIPRGHLYEDEVFYTGRTSSGDFSAEFPMEVTRKVIDRGRERFNIYCSPCHGMTGRGDGIIVQRGMKRPPSYHEQRLVEMPAGYFFDVITNGFGVMYSYASRVKPEDRWAIVAYVRALQKMEPTIPTAESTGTGSADNPVAATTTDTIATPQDGSQDSNR